MQQRRGGLETFVALNGYIPVEVAGIPSGYAFKKADNDEIIGKYVAFTLDRRTLTLANNEKELTNEYKNICRRR